VTGVAAPVSSETRRRVAAGVLGNVLGQVINIANQFALVPVFLVFWGKTRYGEWLTLSAAMSYIVLMDVGMQRYSMNLMTGSHARSDERQYIRVLHSSLLWSVVMAAGAIAVLAPAFAMAPLAKWFHLHLVGPRVASTVAILLGCQTALMLPAGILGGVYTSRGEYPRSIWTSNAHRLAALAATATALALGAGMAGIAMVPLACMLAVIAWLVFDQRRRYPELHIGFRFADLRMALTFVGPGALFLLIQAAMLLRLQGSTLLVGAVLGAGSVAVFVTMRTLANAVLQSAVTLEEAFWPEITALYSTARLAELRRLLAIMTKAGLTLVSAIACILYFAGPHIIHFWTRGRIEYDPVLMASFLLMLISEASWMFCALVLMASNHHRAVAVARLAAAAAGILLGWTLMPGWGMAGAAGGLLIADLLLSAGPVTRLACRHVELGYFSFLRSIVLRGGAVLGAGFLAPALLALLIPAGEFWGAAVLGVAGAAAITAMAYLLWLTAEERFQIRSLAHGLVRDLSARLAPSEI
jgi:O-antigen/teichoic acid export membrane protein